MRRRTLVTVDGVEIATSATSGPLSDAVWELLEWGVQGKKPK